MRSFELTFLGTRGGIGAHSRRHRYHSALLIQGNDARIMIDCGADWLDRVRRIAPTAIVLTHAHPDHAGGLIRGAPCPVYATEETLNLISRYPIHDRRRIPLRRAITIERVSFKAFPVEHSIRAPAVGYRVSTTARDFFYLPDVANVPDVGDALRGVALYIGDGATIKRSMVLKQKGEMVGHAPVTTQLGWCAKAHVRCAIFTHCGSLVVRGDARVLNALVRQIGHRHGVDARLASDGDRLILDEYLHQTRTFKN